MARPRIVVADDLCGYLSRVFKASGSNTICDQHSHIVPPHIAV
jgi:hypothetical protein